MEVPIAVLVAVVAVVTVAVVVVVCVVVAAVVEPEVAVEVEPPLVVAAPTTEVSAGAAATPKANRSALAMPATTLGTRIPPHYHQLDGCLGQQLRGSDGAATRRLVGRLQGMHVLQDDGEDEHHDRCPREIPLRLFAAHGASIGPA